MWPRIGGTSSPAPVPATSTSSVAAARARRSAEQRQHGPARLGAGGDRQQLALGAHASTSSPVALARRRELLVRAGLDGLAEHDHAIGLREQRRARRHQQRRPAGAQLAQRGGDPRLGRGVDRRRRVVQDEHRRVGGQDAGERDPLALAARERPPALADPRREALGHRLGDLVDRRRGHGRPQRAARAAPPPPRCPAGCPRTAPRRGGRPAAARAAPLARARAAARRRARPRRRRSRAPGRRAARPRPRPPDDAGQLARLRGEPAAAQLAAHLRQRARAADRGRRRQHRGHACGARPAARDRAAEVASRSNGPIRNDGQADCGDQLARSRSARRPRAAPRRTRRAPGTRR